MKKGLVLVATLGLLLTLAACGQMPEAASIHQGGEAAAGDRPAEDAAVTLYVSAAASLTEALDAILGQYAAVAPEVTVVPTYDSSGTLLEQIAHGADCDVFLSAAQKQMDTLDPTSGKDYDGLVYIDPDTRVDLLENKVVLVVPEGNPKGVDSFGALAARLEAGDVLLAMGNADVPVGQYTLNLFDFYGLEEGALAAAGVLTYGSNVKEVTAQVSEGTVDCGVVYATDASTAGLRAVDEATAAQCGQVVYPAAVLKDAAHPEAARAFLDYLQSAEAGEVFADFGFTPMDR